KKTAGNKAPGGRQPGPDRASLPQRERWRVLPISTTRRTRRGEKNSTGNRLRPGRGRPAQPESGRVQAPFGRLGRSVSSASGKVISQRNPSSQKASCTLPPNS